MAKITECSGKKIKVNKKSITIINPDNGVTIINTYICN